jgi:two-component system cell cycle sensor histidine kinase/response regulator CckA
MSPAEAMNTIPGNGRLTVLVVDDEPGICEFLAAYLKTKKFQVYVASSAEKAMPIWEEHSAKIDLLLTDVVMPGLNGKGLADKLRAERPELKVIFMSGFLPQELGSDVLKEPFLNKPFHPNELMDLIREVMHQH